MPANQIQYSEKYYDSIYEVRPQALTTLCALPRCILPAWPARLLQGSCPLLQCLVAYLSGLCRPRCGLPPSRCADILLCLGPQYRHVVLPQDIAQLLPKGRLLSEVSIGPAGRSLFETVCRAVFKLFTCVAGRPSGGQLEYSRAVAGSTMPSTGQSPISCSSGVALHALH